MRRDERTRERRGEGERERERIFGIKLLVMANRETKGREMEKGGVKEREKVIEGEDGIMRCRFRDDAVEKGRDEKWGARGEGGGDGEKRRVTTPMEKKIERTESAERIFQRGNFVITREGRGGPRWSDLLAGTRSYRVFLLRLRGPRPHRLDRVRARARAGA